MTFYAWNVTGMTPDPEPPPVVRYIREVDYQLALKQARDEAYRDAARIAYRVSREVADSTDVGYIAKRTGDRIIDVLYKAMEGKP